MTGAGGRFFHRLADLHDHQPYLKACGANSIGILSRSNRERVLASRCTAQTLQPFEFSYFRTQNPCPLFLETLQVMDLGCGFFPLGLAAIAQGLGDMIARHRGFAFKIGQCARNP